MTNTQRIIKSNLIFENSQKSLFHLELNGVFWYFEQRIYKRNYCQEILTDKLDIPWPWRVLCRARSLTYPLSLIDSKNGLDRTDKWFNELERRFENVIDSWIILTSRNFMILCFSVGYYKRLVFSSFSFLYYIQLFFNAPSIFFEKSMHPFINFILVYLQKVVFFLFRTQKLI